MARARNIKPAFFHNETLVELPFEHRLLFVGLWTLADREGRLEDRPKKIKMEIFPADNVDVEQGLSQLEKSGFIHRYVTGDLRIIQVIAFVKHQSPHHTEKKSTLPAFTVSPPLKDESASVEIPLNPDSLNHESRNLNPDSPKPDSGAPVEPPCAIEGAFEEVWGLYPARPGKSKDATLKAFKARLKEGEGVDKMRAGVIAYAVYCQRMFIEPQFIKQPQTFFGPGKHYLADWSAPPGKPASGGSRHNEFQNRDYSAGVTTDGTF